MEVIDALRQDVRDGRIGAERLLDLIEKFLRRLDDSNRQLETANRRIEELEKKLSGSGKIDEPFSMREEEKRQETRGKKKKRKPNRKERRGRIKTADKVAQAERTEQIFPNDVPKSECRLAHTRPVWRLEKGRAVLVAYQIYRGPKNQFGKIPGVLGRSEFGLEIVVQLVYLIHITGLSFDKACGILLFFQNLRLSKSQADALLHQLARHWEREFETLCTLLANSAVVHADETSWSLNSVWALLSEKARVLLYGVHKDAETLKQILDPAMFEGIVISDDAAVYAKFSARKSVGRIYCARRSNSHFRIRIILSIANTRINCCRSIARPAGCETMDDSATRVELGKSSAWRTRSSICASIG